MINSYEQQLIGIATGTFEYKGELYTVKSSYVTMLKSKLNEKKVDLTADQANQAIAKIFSNVEQGVKQNILEKVQGEKAEQAKKEGKVRSVKELKISEETKEKDSKKVEINSESEQKEQDVTITGRDGKTYKVQTTPIDTTTLNVLDLTKVEAAQGYTTDEQVGNQLFAGKMQGFTVMFVTWIVCLIAIGVYLKIFKHRTKAFFVLLGTGLASMAILVLGSILLYCGRAYSTDAWHTVALESGYFKECSEQASREVKKVLSLAEVNVDVSILGLTDDVVYRDAKSIFSSRIEGKGIPALEKRMKGVQEMLQQLLPKESVENVTYLSEVVMQHYKSALDTPYASYLYELKQKDKIKSTMTVVGCVVLLLVALVLMWKGSRFVHRRFRAMAYSIGIAGCGFGTAGIWQLWKVIPMSMYPKVYQCLFEQYLHWLNQNLLYLGIFLICFGLFTWCASYVTKKNHIQKIGFD